jgi:TPR repeat protein
VQNPRALFWYKLAIEKQDSTAMYRLGKLYYEGDEVTEQDYQEAEKWFQEGAKRKEPNCCYTLASMYMVGLGVPKDIDKAIEYFGCAAESGSVAAMHMIGTLLENKAKDETLDKRNLLS